MRHASHLRRLSFDAAMAEVGAAWGDLRAGDPTRAAHRLNGLIAREPDFPPARELMAYAYQGLGDLEAAEREIRQAVALDKREPAFHAALAGILRARGDTKGAERAFRAALERDRRFPPALEGLAALLLGLGRAQEALAVLAPALPAASTPFSLRRLQVQALHALRRSQEALTVLAGCRGTPEARALEAAVLEEIGEGERAEAAVRSVLAAGVGDADAWARLGRLSQARGEFAEAERAYRQALARDPADPAIHAALAELVWMRGGDPAAALENLDATLRQRPSLALVTLKARLLGQLGEVDVGYRLLADAVAADPGNPALRMAAAGAAVAAGRLDDMLDQARALHALRPGDPAAKLMAADALVRTGDFAAALDLLGPLLADRPADQQATNLQALAWRGLGDPRYRDVYDYDRLVRSYALAPPAGWSDLPGFLAELAAALKALHRFDVHPLGQSLRGGTQTSHNLALSTDPTIQAFFRAVAEPIRRYIAESEPQGPRHRRSAPYRIEAAWSVNLRPNGYHVSHLHPDGWISSAFYVETPDGLDQPDRPGWLQFGDPGPAMATPMEPDHFVRPAPGTLVLFPSYMLHGTRPFPGIVDRLTVAFDVVRSTSS